jgi:hypothetical protein
MVVSGKARSAYSSAPIVGAVSPYIRSLLIRRCSVSICLCPSAEWGYPLSVSAPPLGGRWTPQPPFLRLISWRTARIDPGTVRLVTQRLNHYAIPGLMRSMYSKYSDVSRYIFYFSTRTLQILNNISHEVYIIQGWLDQTRRLETSDSICRSSLCLFVYGECTSFISFIIWIFRPYLLGSENSISPLGVYPLLKNSNMPIRKQKYKDVYVLYRFVAVPSTNYPVRAEFTVVIFFILANYIFNLCISLPLYMRNMKIQTCPFFILKLQRSSVFISEYSGPAL